MKLYAAGFNAWNQLTVDPQARQQEPEDIYAFCQILEAENIKTPVSRLSYTIFLANDQFHVSGSGLPPPGVVDLVYAKAENAIGEILSVEYDQDDRTQQRLVRYLSLETYKNRDPVQSWPCEPRAKQVVAYEVGFVVLYDDGTVATLGDPRFEECLGREVDDEHPADEPCLVPQLNDLGEPVRKVAAGGYTAVALTASGALYFWGMGSMGGGQAQREVIPSICGTPNYTEVGEDADVHDVAVGDSHLLALTTEGAIYVIGNNMNGQLGLGTADVCREGAWTRVDFDIPDGFRAASVAAGPRSSFILLKGHDAENDGH